MENINTNVNLTKIEQLLEKLFDFGIQLVIAILILFIGFKLIKILEKSLKKHRKLDKLDPSVKGFCSSRISCWYSNYFIYNYNWLLWSCCWTCSTRGFI